MRNVLPERFTTLSCAVVLLAGIGAAQTTGAIEGTVTDPTGAAVPAASVKLTNEGTGVEYRATTNAAGAYLFDKLPIGAYDIAVEQAGFKTSKVTGIRVDPTARVRRDIALEIGGVQESVNVEAAPSPVQLSDGTVSSVITTEQISTAVINGRNYARMMMLMPGAVYHSGNDELSGAGLNAPGSPVSINGVNNKSSGWFVDGAYDMNQGNGEASPHIPPLDAIQEIQVQTSNYSAKYGTTGGSVINTVTKNGTAQFHGNAYEYFRNDKMDARNFFSPAVVPLKQNNYGFSIGGPVILPHYNKNRNKTFFFWNEDWRKRRNATTLLTATPTDAMRAGNFQAEAARLGKPVLDPTTKQPFPNNIIPMDRIDPNALLLLKTYFPLPNNPGGGFNNYINLGVGKVDPRTDTVRIDHNFTDNLRIAGTISHDHIDALNPNVPLLNASPFPSILQAENTTGATGTVNLAWVINHTTTNELQYSYKRFHVNLLLQGTAMAEPTRPQGLTIKDYYPGANTLNLIPNISFAQGFGGVGTSVLPISPATDDTHIISDNFSHIAGKHTLQAGGLVLHYTKDQAVNNSTQGSYSFTGISTNDPIADFLVGTAQTYSESSARFIRDYSFNQTEWYFQDDWRASKRLTLNLGVRLFDIPLTVVDGDQMSSFLPSRYDPGKAPQVTSAGVLVPTANYDPLNGIVIAGKGVPRGFVDPYWALAPRFGFAFDPTGSGKTAIRGGYGISYLNSGTNQSALVLNPPFNVMVSLQTVPLSDPSQGTPTAPRPASLNAFNPDYKRPMVHSWSFTMQRELPGQLLVMAGYVGSRGTNWEVWIDRNSPDFGYRPPGLDFDPRINTSAVNTNAIRPFQGYADITQFNSGLSSNYHSLQTMFQRRFANGFALQGTYTWSKTTGQSQTRRDMRVQDPLNWALDYGVTDFDRTHVFSMNYIWDLPLLRGRRDFLGQVFGNWEVAGFFTAQSGLAMSPGLSTATRGLATRPDATGANVTGARTKEQWFNPAAFAAPAFGLYGNAGVGTIRGPGFWDWDTSLSKLFPIHEQIRARLSGEFFNILNHTNWSGVSTSLGSGNYGQITSSRDPRRVQLALRVDF
jgi:hypothetical protein